MHSFIVFYSYIKINSSKNHKNKTECNFKVVTFLWGKYSRIFCRNI